MNVKGEVYWVCKKVLSLACVVREGSNVNGRGRDLCEEMKGCLEDSWWAPECEHVAPGRTKRVAVPSVAGGAFPVLAYR